MDQYIGTPTNKPVLFDGQEKGGFSFYTLKETAANVMAFQLNLNHLDKTKRELFNNLDFRRALRRPGLRGARDLAGIDLVRAAEGGEGPLE